MSLNRKETAKALGIAVSTLDLRIKENFNGFISPVYEDLCIEYLLNNYDLLKCGRWWDNDIEIDAVGIAKDYLIVAECKYSNKKVGTDILQNLKEKSKNIKTTLKIKHYVLFSKSGFTDALKNLSDDSVILVELV